MTTAAPTPTGMVILCESAEAMTRVREIACDLSITKPREAWPLRICPRPASRLDHSADSHRSWVGASAGVSRYTTGALRLVLLAAVPVTPRGGPGGRRGTAGILATNPLSRNEFVRDPRA